MKMNSMLILSIDDLKFYERFHIRVSVLYTVVVLFLVILPMSLIFYRLTLNSEMINFSKRLVNIAASLAVGIDGTDVVEFRTEEALKNPKYQLIKNHISAVMHTDPSIYSIYILLPTDNPDVMNFAFNLDSKRSSNNIDREPPNIGESYHVSNFPKMRIGMQTAIAENELIYDGWSFTISGYAPIKNLQGHSIGIIGVDIDATSINTVRYYALFITLGISLIALFLFMLGGILVGRSVRKPLEQIIQVTSKVASGDLNAKIYVYSNDEFGLVSKHFDKMVDDLREREHIREIFGRYVSEDVAKSVLANSSKKILGGELREVTVLFSDIQGYSTISERLSPTEVVNLLNQYFSKMNDVLDEHKGVVIELLGDAILAVFNAPQQLENHAEAAVRCAIQMREQLELLNQEWQKSGIASYWQKVGLDKLKQRIGVHTGEVIAGNLGSSRRIKYAVIGDNVNLAARLEQLNKEIDSNGILLSGSCAAKLPAELLATCKHVSTQMVKGRQQPVEVFSV